MHPRIFDTFFIMTTVCITSCSNPGNTASTETKQIIEQANVQPASWRKALINTACGPDDGLINQIRLGWHVDQTTHSMSPSYPFLIIDYRENEDKTVNIFNVEYCTATQQCEYSSAEKQQLIVNPKNADGSFSGNYAIRLMSGKFLSGKFEVEKTVSPNNTKKSDQPMMLCG
jgi:hypothetical protein